jgi:hypothetical protein
MRKWSLLLIVVVALAVAPASAVTSNPPPKPALPLLVDGHGVKWWAARARARARDAAWQKKRARALTRQLQSVRDNPAAAIRHVFGVYADQALAVAWCESRYSVTAANGRYLGLFQMGSSERARYGHGADALTQARAAYRYFVAAGRDWSPWTCRPW